jgi:hypothetical protein
MNQLAFKYEINLKYLLIIIEVVISVLIMIEFYNHILEIFLYCLILILITSLKIKYL